MRDKQGRTVVERSCASCQKVFWARPRPSRPSAGQYCSRACHYAGERERRGRPVLPCEYCKTPFTSKVRTKGVRTRFCSPRCNALDRDIGSTLNTLRWEAYYAAQAHWPFGRTDDPMIAAVNDAVSKDWDEDIRQEVAQEMILALLEGRLTIDRLQQEAPRYRRRTLGAAPPFGSVPLQWPVPRTRNLTYEDTLSAEGAWDRPTEDQAIAGLYGDDF